MNKELWKHMKQPRIDFAEQEMQVGMARPYTAKTLRRHSQASPRVESPRQTGQEETE